MTYNWNTMVEITVPTGTNGWLYSGEVIINGVKVRFPVGVPTSVPEPAAVLLKKMIELEQEEDANTAKPQNHYVGDVTIPAGKTLTLEKGAKFVDNSGPSEVVILPETELVYTEAMGQPAFAATIQATPKAYTLAKVVYNGAPYDCVVAEQAGSTVFGNADFMKGGDNGKPFLAMTAPNPDGSTLLLCVPLDGASSVTMSVTQVESKTAGVFVISVTCDSEKGSDGHYANATMDKTVDEINVAYALGNVVVCRLQINALGGRHELSMKEYKYDEGYDFGPAGGENSYVKSVYIQNNGVVGVW